MAQRRNWNDRMRRIGPMAGALALLFQIVSWAWMPAALVPGMGAADAATTIAGDRQTVICTPDGFKSVFLAMAGDVFAGAEAKVPGSTGPTDHDCPLCPLVGGLAAAAPPPDVSPAEIGRYRAVVLPGERIAAGWFLSTLQARAPPSVG